MTAVINIRHDRSVLNDPDVLTDATRHSSMHGIDPSDTAKLRTARVSATFRTLAG